MAKQKSRTERWSEAVHKIQDGVAELQDLKGEYNDWFDNMSENLQSSATAEKLQEIIDCNEIDEIESAADTLDGMDLPQGFGRD